MVVHQRRKEKQQPPNADSLKEAGGPSPAAWDDKLPVPSLSPCPAALLLFTVAVAAFANSYDGVFVFDDAEAIEKNKDVTDQVPFTDLFQHDFWGSKLASNTSHKSYRPLTVISFRLNWWFSGGLNPVGFHVVNIVLHGLVCVLLYPALTVLFHEGTSSTGSKAALCCSLLFAVHPIHTESVAGIVGRADLLCAVTFLLSFLSYAHSCQKGFPVGLPPLLFSMACCGTSVLFKEQGITVLGICSACDVIIIQKIDIMQSIKTFSIVQHTNHHKPDQNGGLFWRHLVLLLTGTSLLVMRWRVMGSSAPTFQVVDNPHSYVNGTLYRVLNYNYLYSLNVWLLLVPWWLCFDWSMGCVPVLQSLTDPRVLAVLAFWAGMGILLYTCLYTPPSRGQRLLMMGVAMLVIPFLPASNLFFRVGFVVAERNLYLPSIGFCVLLTTGMISLSSSRTLRYLLLAGYSLVLVLFLARCMQRSNDWRSEELLFQSGASVCPLNAKVHYNIGKIHADKGNTKFAEKKYREAVRLNPEYDQALNNLANLLKDRNQNEEAEHLLERAVSINPKFAAAWMNLGIVQSALGKVVVAEQSYLTALRHRRKYPDCYYNLGNLYLELKRHKDALVAWRNATLQKADHSNAWTNMIILLDDMGRVEDAELAAAEALQYLPADAVIHYNLANALGKAGKYEKSEQHFLKAIQLAPNNPTYHSNLGVLYHRWEKNVQAEKHYMEALRLNPDNSQTQENLNMLHRKMGKAV